MTEFWGTASHYCVVNEPLYINTLGYVRVPYEKETMEYLLQVAHSGLQS